MPGLDFINQLRPVSYFIDKASVNTFLGLPEDVKNNLENIATEPVRKTGFLAQEVEQIVNEGKFVFNGVDAPQNEKDYYGIRYATFVVPLVKP